MEAVDKGLDMLFMEFLAQHLKGEEDLIYAGPDVGAHNPMFFFKVEELPKGYRAMKTALSIVRSTAGLYDSPDRSLVGISKAWCLATDFDYDRGEWAGADRRVQDITLYEFCSLMPPTSVVQTRNGFHLYWVLDKPMPSMDYAYPASLIKANIKADPRSILPMQCLNFYSNDPRKPAVMVDKMEFKTLNKTIPVFPNEIPYYRVNDIITALGKVESEELKKLRQNMHARYSPTGDNYERLKMKRKERALEIMEKYDVVAELNNAGFKAYGRPGGKVICCCPFHDDRHPSAYLDLNPNSDFFGTLYCTSTSCSIRAPLERVMEQIGAPV